MKDLFENALNSLNFCLVNCWDITFEGHMIPNAINEEKKNCLWLKNFNFDF